jgi:predicted phosphodiesterase
VFDRSFLPEARFEFVVMADTHYTYDTERHADVIDPREPETVLSRQWSARSERALQLAASLETSFVVHLGDLTEEYPEREEDFVKSRQAAREQIERYGQQTYVAAGNMDIGDKSSPTTPAAWVTPTTLADWHEQFGPSWFSFDHEGVHFVVLNSQIMESELPQADEQKRWTEADLAEHTGRRIFTFLHVPPFFVDEREQGLGFYNVLDEPAREWLLGLLRKHKVEGLFSGHLHFSTFNRIDTTRHYGVPSTTMTRNGFYEVYSIRPEQPRNDVDKMGFHLVRVHDDGVRVHVVRTNGETAPADDSGPSRRLITRTPPDLPESPLGVNLSLPLSKVTEGAIDFPSAVRQPVRDDYPLLGCLELGVRHLRVPMSDLAHDFQSRRLAIARDEGIQVTAVWLWSERLKLEEAVRPHADQLDAVEMQMPGTIWPENAHLEELERCVRETGKPVTLAPLLAREPTRGAYHPHQAGGRRFRIGYRTSEMYELNRRLSGAGSRVERVLCHIDGLGHPWDDMQEFGLLLPLSQVGGLDFVVPLPGTDEEVQIRWVAEAVLAAAGLGGCRLFLDSLVDMDRTPEFKFGLLDRLSNPRRAFHVARCLNTILFSSGEEFQAMAARDIPGGRVLGLRGGQRSLWLILPQGRATVSPTALEGLDPDEHDGSFFDLVAGTRRSLTAGEPELREALTGLEGPSLVVSEIR